MEITVETSRLVIRRDEDQTPLWCAECSASVQAVTPGEAAALAGVSTGTVYLRAEADRLHFVEGTGRPTLICLNSLLVSNGEGGGDHAAEQPADRRNHD